MVQPKSVEALAKDCEFIDLRDVHPTLKDAENLIVEEIQRRESDYKELSQEYAKLFKNVQ